MVTDGEMRRTSFQSQLTEAVEGFANVGIDAFLWGDWHGDDAVGGVNRPRPEGLGVTGTLRPRRRLSTEEFTYVRGRTSRIAKVTLPSPSLFASLWQEAESASAYPTIESFLEDIARILRDEVAELVRLGLRPTFILTRPTTRSCWTRRGPASTPREGGRRRTGWPTASSWTTG